jgi:hypothetical protein
MQSFFQVNIKYVALFIALVCISATAQMKELVLNDTDRSYFGEKLPDKLTTFQSDDEAEDVVKKIVAAVGLVPNFDIRIGGIGNAAAVIENGKRLIIYDQFFIRDLTQKTGTKWAAISIMAHEVGHHLNAHTLDGRGSRPNIELEADSFSGFVLQKMGASLEEARRAMELMGTPIATRTHPAKHDRLAAITKGWIQSCNADPKCNQSALSEPKNSPQTQQCPAGTELTADRQGGLARGEGYCKPCVRRPPGWGRAQYPDECRN